MSVQTRFQHKGMPYVRLGSSGLKISRLVLGCMSYGDPRWSEWVIGEEDAIKQIKFAYDHGINAFDTANVYSGGESERILGKAIKQLDLPRDEIVVMTKVYFTCRNLDIKYDGKTDQNSNPDQYGFVNQHGLSRKHIFDSIKHSLERLQLDYVDVLQCHRFDYETSIEETMHALNDVVKAGYARYIGMSSCHAWQFQAMQNYALNNQLTPFISMQNHYNLLYREEEREMFPTLDNLQMKVGSIPWSPLAEGLLARPFDAGTKTKRGETDEWINKLYAHASTHDIVSVVEKIAEKKNVSMAQVALSWVMNRHGVSAPIIGATSIEKLKDSIGAVHLKLTDDEVKELEAPYQPQAISGHV